MIYFVSDFTGEYVFSLLYTVNMTNESDLSNFSNSGIVNS